MAVAGGEVRSENDSFLMMRVTICKYGGGSDALEGIIEMKKTREGEGGGKERERERGNVPECERESYLVYKWKI